MVVFFPKYKELFRYTRTNFPKLSFLTTSILFCTLKYDYIHRKNSRFPSQEFFCGDNKIKLFAKNLIEEPPKTLKFPFKCFTPLSLEYLFAIKNKHPTQEFGKDIKNPKASLIPLRNLHLFFEYVIALLI